MQYPVSARRSGFTLVELLIVIGVIVVLIALLLPSVASVRARARTAECQSNLTQLGLALNAANRNRSTPVRSSSWAADIAPFLEGENEELFVCPADFQAENRNAEEQDPTNPQFKGSFGANNQMHRMQGSDANKFTLVDLGDGDADGTNESQFFVSPEQDGDNQWSTNPNGQAAWDAGINDASDRHAGNINVLHSDGSVSAESSDDLLENHPGSGSGDWVPWRFGDERWEGSNTEVNPDRDGDGILNSDDNCPDTFNPDQADADGNDQGDACEPAEEEEEETGGEDTGGEDTGGEDTGGEDTGDEEDTADEEPADPGCSGDDPLFLDCPLDLPPNTMTSGWNVVASPNPPGFEKSGFDGFREATAGNGNAVFTWRFLDLPNGRYSVAVTWGKKGNRATNIQYTVAHDFGTLGTSDAINQKIAPQADFQDAAAPNAAVAFQEIGVFDVLHGHLYVSVDNNTNGTVCADAVRIQCVGSAETKSTCSEGPGAGFVNGLYGEYRAGVWNFGFDPATAEPFVARIDADMNEPYGGNFETCDHPAQNPPDCWSGHGVRWVGEIRAQFAEEYQFYVARDDATRVIINGQTVMDSLVAVWDPPGAQPIPVGDPVAMSDCEWVPIEILNGEYWGISFFRLQWSSFSTPLQDIPTENFRTTPLLGN